MIRINDFYWRCVSEKQGGLGASQSTLLQKVSIEEFEQTIDYGVKDTTKLDDFNQVVDWQNSSLIKQLINYLALLVKYQ